MSKFATTCSNNSQLPYLFLGPRINRDITVCYALSPDFPLTTRLTLLWKMVRKIPFDVAGINEDS